MKKYKLIKTYPGGPKTIGLETNGFYEDFNLSDYPEFWEPINEIGYKILEFQSTDEDLEMIVLKSNGQYNRLSAEFGLFKLDEMLYLGKCVKSGDWKITKIQRLSDGEIFQIGDFVKLNKDWSNNNKITNFIFKNNKLDFEITQGYSSSEYGESLEQNIDLWTKVQKRFYTHDLERFDIGDQVWWVGDDKKIYNTIWSNLHGKYEPNTYFLTEEKCKEFIKELQKQEILKTYHKLKDQVLEYPGLLEINMKKIHNNTLNHNISFNNER